MTGYLSESYLPLLLLGFHIILCMNYLSFRETRVHFLILYQTKHSQKTYRILNPDGAKSWYVCFLYLSLFKVKMKIILLSVSYPIRLSGNKNE